MSKPEGGPLSNPEVQKVRRDKEKLAKVQLDADWKAVMASRAGRNVLAWVLAQTRHDAEDYHENDARNRVMQGLRVVGLAVIARMKATDLQLYRLMEDEQRGAETPREGEDDA